MRAFLSLVAVVMTTECICDVGGRDAVMDCVLPLGTLGPTCESAIPPNGNAVDPTCDTCGKSDFASHGSGYICGPWPDGNELVVAPHGA